MKEWINTALTALLVIFTGIMALKPPPKPPPGEGEHRKA